MISGPPRWVLFCEADADARVVHTLVDEVVALRCASWVRELLEATPEAVRIWWPRSVADDRRWFDLHGYPALAGELGVKLHYGHFGGRPHEAGALMLDTIFLIVRRLWQRAPESERPSAVVVLWDADDDSRTRRAGIRQALEFGTTLPEGVACVVALADPEREAWVLAGFEPENDDERAALARERQRLGFPPHEQAHRLSAGREQSKTNTKHVMDRLGITSWERERECLRIGVEARRALLAARGSDSGLAHWLDELEVKLVPQVDPSARSRA